MNTVFIRNNPYLRRVEIQINGDSPSSYSRLNSIMNEPFLFWVNQIILLIHDEINEDEYRLIFESRQEEIEILEKLARDDEKCVSFVKHKLIRNTPLNDRMASLSSLLKEHNIRASKIEFSTLFIVPDDSEQLKIDLQEMQVQNSYCRIIPKVVFRSEYREDKEKADAFFLISKGSKKEEAVDIPIKQGFLVKLSDENGFMGIKDKILVYSTTEKFFFDTIFHCLMLGLLEEALYRCISSISKAVREEYINEFDNILSSSPKVFIDVDSDIVEKGSSIYIRLSSDCGKVKSSDFTYDYSVSGIISCNGIRIEGIKNGESILYIYRKGDREPCAKKKFKVITRNRVNKLHIEGEYVYIGEGDKYKAEWTFMPLESDNLDKLEWISYDNSIATVSKQGIIYGIKQGDTIVRLQCENVSAVIKVHVLPHIRDIKVSINEMVLAPQIRGKIDIASEPSICIEGRLLYSVMDARVANVVNGYVTAFSIGETVLVVQDGNERLRKEIPIKVISQKKWDRLYGVKKGFFAKLFGG